MPTVALPPHQRPPYAMVASAEDLILSESQGNGVEANRLFTLANEVFAHWSQRAEVLMASVESDDDVVYEHLLPSPNFVVKVRYKAVGKLEPRRFRIDD